MIALVRPRRAPTGARPALFAMATLIALAGLSALAVSACGDNSVGPTEERPRQQLLFLSTRVGATDQYDHPLRDIYRVNADGTGVRPLFNHPGDHSPPGPRTDPGSCSSASVTAGDGCTS